MNPALTIAYICVKENPLLVSHIGHFVDTFKSFPPGHDHRLIVVCNGGALPPKIRPMFAPIPHEFYIRPNDGGWDISGYMDVATHFPSDLQVCLGESVYFHRQGWLSRLVESFEESGPGIYGIYASFMVRPHLNTTAFAVSPRFLVDYPKPKGRHSRYQFEHGTNSLWRNIAAVKGATKLVTWDGCYDPQDWRKAPNILWRGDQSNCLVWSNHVDRYNAATKRLKEIWAYGADAIAK